LRFYTECNADLLLCTAMPFIYRYFFCQQIQGQVGEPLRTLRIHTGELLHFGKKDPAHYRGILGTIGTIAREEGFR
jgi:hypothetical protein